jgi:hypothetical protein
MILRTIRFVEIDIKSKIMISTARINFATCLDNSMSDGKRLIKENASQANDRFAYSNSNISKDTYWLDEIIKT